MPSTVAEWCRALYDLQMACERIANAYRLRNTAADPDELMRVHLRFRRFVRADCKAPQVTAVFEGQVARV